MTHAGPPLSAARRHLPGGLLRDADGARVDPRAGARRPLGGLPAGRGRGAQRAGAPAPPAAAQARARAQPGRDQRPARRPGDREHRDDHRVRVAAGRRRGGPPGRLARRGHQRAARTAASPGSVATRPHWRCGARASRCTPTCRGARSPCAATAAPSTACGWRSGAPAPRRRPGASPSPTSSPARASAPTTAAASSPSAVTSRTRRPAGRAGTGSRSTAPTSPPRRHGRIGGLPARGRRRPPGADGQGAGRHAGLRPPIAPVVSGFAGWVPGASNQGGVK